MNLIPWFNRKKDENGFIPIDVGPTNADEPGQFDPASPTWQYVERKVRADIKSLQRDLEKDLDTEQTAKVRGQIARCRKVLALPDEVSRDISRLSNSGHRGILAGTGAD